MKKTFAFIVLVVLMCSLGNRALAQNEGRKTYTMTTEKQGYIDFTGWQYNDNGQPNATIDWEGNQIEGISGTGTDGNPLERTYEEFPVYVGSGDIGSTYSSTVYNSTIIRSDEQYYDDNWSNHISISNSYFSDANVGDIVRVNFKDKRDNFEYYFKSGTNQWWTDFPYSLSTSPEDPVNYFQFTINNNDVLNELIHNGLGLQGVGFTLTSVELLSPTTSTENTWGFWRNGTFGGTYLVKNGAKADYFNITNLKDGDVVTIWGDNGCRVTSNNTNQNNQDLTFDTNNPTRDVTMTSDGTLQLLFSAQWSGVRKIEIRRNEDQVTTFDYDPGYEEYDMYDEFSWIKNSNPATTYSLTGSAGFELNGTDAQYATFSGSKVTTNNRIALTVAPNYGTDDYGENVTTNDEWAFDFGLVPPGDNGDYSFLSICNLREGDRVVISYINEYGNIEDGNPLIFASGFKDGAYYYDGSSAFKDDDRDGVLDEGEASISNGQNVSVDWHRGEGNVGNNDNGWGSGVTPELYYINSYVMTEDGHLDLAFRRFVQDKTDSDPKLVSRIVKIKIFSDHQAMMVDKWEEEQKHYKAYYNITGELQAKEHIMPGGLEIFVGNNDASQHALVVSSKDGPVSYVNAVDGFKIPGISKDTNGKVSINFDLGVKKDQNGKYDASKLPTTGSFYRFVPEVNGKMSFKFEAKSMNYYRYDLKGNAIYHNTDLTHINKNNNGTWDNDADDYYELVEGSYGSWNALNDRPNEQTVDKACPYYLVTVEDGQITDVEELGDIENGGDGTQIGIEVEKGKEYYLFGGWNQSDLYYTSSWIYDENMYQYISQSGGDTQKQFNNIEFRPFDGRTVGCGVAQLLWVTFDPNKKIYPLAKWVPNGTRAVKDVPTGENSGKVGVPNPDTFELEYDLADLWGYDIEHTAVTIKKMAGNIKSCHPFLQKIEGANPGEPTLKLMIDNIVFDTENNKNPGGTILIKIDDPLVRENPLYALTIAYSAEEAYDNEQREVINNETSEAVRGHIWDFHTSSLKGLTWTNGTANGAEEKEMGTYFANYYGQSIANYSSAAEVQTGLRKNENSFLFDEVEDKEKGDWMFNYNLVYDGNLFDPVFTNKYDMAGDNADMIWDTEGTIFQTSANQCAIFNEYVNDDATDDEYELEVVDHTATSTTDDPNRYVALLKGGVFRIPWLMPNDRVVIWMGSGTGRTDDFAALKIRNAYDALHNSIDPEDEYIVGGSHWNGANEDANYRGCYHFFAKGNENSTAPGKAADMVFEMVGGEMCKIYKVRIYRGDRIITNEVVGKTAGDKFLLWSREADPNDESTADYLDENYYNWTLKYLGKDQQLANGTGKNTQENEIIAQTGKYNSTPALTNNRVDPEDNTSKVESFTYKHSLGEIGTFRMRGKDMEKNMNYVADYADHNVTIAYQQTQPYPYTWDFTDVTGIESNVTNYFTPEEQLGEVRPTELSQDVWGSLSDESYQKTARDLSLWEVFGTAGNYFLRLNSQTSQTPQNLMERDNVFESAKEIGGNQVWANKTIVPEMQGLWFYTENYDPETDKSYDNLQSNGEWIIIQGDVNNPGGLEFKKGNCDWFNKIVVPNVPNKAAVYLRMRKLTTNEAKVRYMFGQQESMSELSTSTTNTTGSTSTTKTFYSIGNGDYIVAIMNTTDSKSNLTLSLDGFRVQKLAVSTDPKQIGKTGYATESRAQDIDHNLTSYLTGKNIKAYKAKLSSDGTKVVLTQFGATETEAKILPASENGEEHGGCILKHEDGVATTDGNTDRTVSILDGGFHEFVADLHDKVNESYKVDTSDNILKSFRPITGPFTVGQTFYVGPYDGSNTNLILSAKKYDVTVSGASAQAQEGYDVFFIRVDPNGNSGNGATLKENSAYMQLPTSDMKPLATGGGNAKFSIVFEDDTFGDINDGIATGITDAAAQENSSKSDWYSLDGRKLSNAPTEKGLYILNGRIVVVK